MTKNVFLITLLSLGLISPLALATQAQSYGCEQKVDGASVKIFDRELGFSSVQECESQLAFFAHGNAESVICGCTADNTPAGSILGLLGAMVGIMQTNMNLECYRLAGNQLERIRFKSFDIIRKTELPNDKKGHKSEYFKDRVEACKLEEKRLFIEMNTPVPLPSDREPI